MKLRHNHRTSSVKYLLAGMAGLTLLRVPSVFAACSNTSSMPDNLHYQVTDRWDPILHQHWISVADCNHPERPSAVQTNRFNVHENRLAIPAPESHLWNNPIAARTTHISACWRERQSLATGGHSTHRNPRSSRAECRSGQTGTSPPLESGYRRRASAERDRRSSKRAGGRGDAAMNDNTQRIVKILLLLTCNDLRQSERRNPNPENPSSKDECGCLFVTVVSRPSKSRQLQFATHVRDPSGPTADASRG